MKARTFCWIVAAFCLFASAPAWALGPNAPTWLPAEIVTTDGKPTAHKGADRSIASDHYGNVGIAYCSYANYDLYYAQRMPGLGWTSWTVDSAGSVGKYPSLAFDRYERPAISYYDFSNGDLKYAHYDGSAWQTQTVDATGGYYTSLAFDVYGRAAIAYRAGIGILKFAYDQDGDGTFEVNEVIQVTDGTFNEGYYPTLAFDPQNRPMIAHYDSNYDDIRFSMPGPGGWTTGTIATDAFISTYPLSMAVNPSTGYPAIAYEKTGNDLIYMEWDGNGWVSETVAGYGMYMSLAFDPADGNPAIAYCTGAQSLQFSWHDGNDWHTQSLGHNGVHASVTFNEYGDGWPVLAYFSQTTGPTTLYFRQDPPALPEPATLSLLALALPLLIRRRRRRR